MQKGGQEMIVWITQLKAADDEFPTIKVFRSEDEARKQIVRWINYIRGEEKLPRFKLADYDTALEWLESSQAALDGTFVTYGLYEVE
jgi:hypothetical protein